MPEAKAATQNTTPETTTEAPVEPQAVPTGETALSRALRAAFAEINTKVEIDSNVTMVADKALNRIVSDTSIYGAKDDVKQAAALVMEAGADKLVPVIAHFAIEGSTQMAKQLLSAITKEALNSVFFGYLNIYKQQERAAKAMTGGVNGFELSYDEIVNGTEGSEPYANAEAKLTPMQEHEAFESLYSAMAMLYFQCDRIMRGASDREVNELPVLVYATETEGGAPEYHQIFSLTEAINKKHSLYEESQAKRAEKNQNVLRAATSMDFSKTLVL